mmetsp:Transcript_65084/g.180508  ORF Transcript_65084/g.180508 Transcript_65084/m.180508 type:complete len:233 (+) Transcript_65084:1-699(+)
MMMTHRCRLTVKVFVAGQIYSQTQGTPPTACAASLHEGHWPLGCVERAQLLFHEWEFCHDGELQLCVVHLLDMLTSTLRSGQCRCVDDLDGARLCAVAPGHLRVHLAHGTVDVDVAVLLVHVVRVRAALVAQPDAVVLDLRGAAVVKLIDSEQLTTALLCLVQLLHEVPKPRLCQHGVLGEQAHPEYLGGGVLGRRGCAAHDLVLMDLCPQRGVLLELAAFHHLCALVPRLR